VSVTIPEPEFIERDPETIEQQVIATWESEGGEALEPGQVEMLFLKTVAYRETLVRIGLQEAAKLNLLKFSEFPVVDYLGELLVTPRLDAQCSLTTLRWTLGATHGTDVTIESGTRVRTKDGKYMFATLGDDAVIAAGSLHVDVAAACTVAGTVANGYIAGQIVEWVDSVPSQVASVTNLTTTSSGTTSEATPAYIERLLVAPDAMSSAGGTEAYRYYALSASSAVADVAVSSPGEGEVSIAVLATTGNPSSELMALVETAVSGERVRPLCDNVTVVAASSVTWALEAELTLYANADSDSVLAASEAAAVAYASARRAKLRRSVVRSQVIAALSVSGVFSVELIQPAVDVSASEDEWLDCTSISVEVVGFSAEVLDE